VLSIFEVISTCATPLDTVVVDNKTWLPPPIKLASNLFKTPASLIKNSSVSAGAVANSVSSEIISCASFEFVIKPSSKSEALNGLSVGFCPI